MKTEFFLISPLGLCCAIGIGLFVGRRCRAATRRASPGICSSRRCSPSAPTRTPGPGSRTGASTAIAFGLWHRTGDLPTRRISRTGTETTLH